MRRIDDWLIDSVFQPFADRLPAWMSCYGVAAFLLTGLGLEQIAYCMLRQNWIGLLLLSTWMPYTVTHVYRLDRLPARNVAPVDRIARFVLRAAYLLWLLPCIPIAVCFASDSVDQLSLATWLVIGPIEYLIACRKNPPKEKRSIVRGHSAWSVT